MRILHLTDTHLGTRMPALGGPPGWRRAHDHAEAMRAALLPAMREEVDLVLHTGDVFNRSRPPAAAMQRAAELLTQAARRVPVVVMPGNHDRWGIRRSLPLGAPGLTLCDRPTRLRFGQVAVAVVPYQRLPQTWAAAAREVCAAGVDLLMAHQAFHGAVVPGLVFREGRQRDTLGEQHLPAGVRHILCGHIHPRQVTELGGALVVQPGSTERTSFSEAHEQKGYAVWELGAQVRWRFVDLPTRPMRRVERPDELRGLPRGALVRSQLPTEQVLEAGGWPLLRRTRRPPRTSPQLRLFSP